MLWKATAINGGPTPLHDLDVTVPIPSSTRYVEGSAAPLTLGKTRILPRFSFDGGRNFGFAPLKKRVVTTEGGRRLEKEVEVRPDEYTHVRWSIPTLDARSKAEVTLRTRVR
ncbi:hypothetical protein [Deinococcus carri]|uniref:hypothetical protein n=1 Tax=Deinococcus carri TaxID=1211323 RepID=UPI0031ED2902